MANENARLHLGTKKKPTFDETLKILKDRLHLTNVPYSIGAFDVSTIYGSESVGAFIFWEAGDFMKDKYRHLKIKGVSGVDDYAMMHEIVERVLRKEHLIPNLVVIDGGKGQLEVARKVMEGLDIKTDIIAVAKKPDRAFLINDEIIDLEDKSSSSLLLKKIRDEVHRFAIGFHRKLRDKRLMESPLEKISGIGKKRRLELLRHFKSIGNIRKATVDEIAKIKGFNKKVAEKVIEGVRKG
jgi:excinuclease ABC subunit C